MKIYIAILTILGLSLPASATNPYPPKTVVSSSGRLSAELHSNPPSTAIIVSSRKQAIHFFSFEDLPFPNDFSISRHIAFTTAGRLWYRNSIAFFDHTETFLIIRLEWGDHIVLDLRRSTMTWGLPADLKEEAMITTKTHVLDLLNSDDARNRKVGAIIAGQLQFKKANPRLTELLSDESSQIVSDGTRHKTVFFVRKAARESLVLMKETPADVVVEYYPASTRCYSSRFREFITVTNTIESLTEFHELEAAYRRQQSQIMMRSNPSSKPTRKTPVSEGNN